MFPPLPWGGRMAAATPVEGRGDVWLLWQFLSVCDAACRDAILGLQVLRTISVNQKRQVLFKEMSSQRRSTCIRIRELPLYPEAESWMLPAGPSLAEAGCWKLDAGSWAFSS